MQCNTEIIQVIMYKSTVYTVLLSRLSNLINIIILSAVGIKDNLKIDEIRLSLQYYKSSVFCMACNKPFFYKEDVI